MKNKSYILIIVLTLALPQVVSAAWWNPISWSFWSWNNKPLPIEQITKPEVNLIQKINTPPVNITVEKKAEVKKPVSKPKIVTPKAIVSTTTAIKSEIGVTNADRQRFGYKGKTYQQTLDEVIAISSVDRSVIIKGMQEHEAFKLLMEDLMNKYEDATKKAVVNAQAECLLMVTLDNERTYDPKIQDYLRKVRCGTATETDKANYGNLGLQSTNVTQTVQMPQIQFPSVIKPAMAQKWQIRWEGSGVGTLVTPAGQQRFHCESGGCQSY